MPGGTGWYRKNFTLPSDYAGKSIVLNFDGSYNHTYVYVNGTKVGEKIIMDIMTLLLIFQSILSVTVKRKM